MPQSLVKNYIHLTFSTKNRYAFIDEYIEVELFSYLGGICKNLECYPLAVGGYRDYVHILCSLSRKIALMKFIEEVKAHSSKWMKTKGNKYQKFYQQHGYGAFSVNPSDIDIVKAYITNQKEHHFKKTFMQEYRGFLENYNVSFDEQYVWD